MERATSDKSVEGVLIVYKLSIVIKSKEKFHTRQASLCGGCYCAYSVCGADGASTL